MRALILAAGWGTRLGRAARGRAKALVPIGSRHALDWALCAADRLVEVDRIDVLASAYHAPGFHAWASERRPRARLRVLDDGVTAAHQRRGAIGDLAYYLDRFPPADDLLVLAGDNVFDLPLAALARHARVAPTVVVMDLGHPDRVRPYASVVLDQGGRVTELVEKDPAPPSSLAATALYGIPRARQRDPRAYLEAGGLADNLGHLARWWSEAGLLRGVLGAGRWIDVGTAADLARARRLFGDET